MNYPNLSEIADDALAALGTNRRQGLSEALAKTRPAHVDRNALSAEDLVPAW